jgi:hypothetical protein
VPRRRRIAVLALLAAGAVAALAGVLAGRARDAGGPGTVADPAAEALAYADPHAPVAAVVATDAGTGAGARLAALVDRLPGNFIALPELQRLLADLVGLPYGAALKPLLGHPVVVTLPEARSTRGAQLVFVARDPSRPREVLDAEVDAGAVHRAGDHRGARLYVRGDGRAYAVRAQVLIAGPSVAAVTAALDRRAARTGLTRRTFDARLHGLPGTAGAVARVAASPAILGSLPRIPWVAAQRGVALALVPGADDLRLKVRIATAPTADGDLPLARGPQPPDLHGRAEVVAGVRDPAATLPALEALAAAERPTGFAAFDRASDSVAHFTGVDVRGDVLRRLTGTLTITSNLSGITLRGEVDDPERVATTLGRLREIARLAPLAGLAGVDLDGYRLTEQDGRYVITRDDEPQLVFGVRGRVLIASSDPHADLARIAAAPTTTAGAAAGAGALRALVAKPVLDRLITERLHLPRAVTFLLAPVGAATITGRAEPTATDLEIAVPVRR